MDVSIYNRHSRRSTTNLNHLSLAPLTPRFPLGDEEELPDFSIPTHRSSYIEGRSAPTTPGILSRRTSPTRHRVKQSLVVPKSKSAITLPRPRSSKKLHTDTTASSSEWLLRAGAALSTSTLESKGQSWLTTRASSTSLTGNDGTRDDNLSFADDEFSPISTRNSRDGFVAKSRNASARNSRRGSRVGSKVEMLEPLTSGDLRESEGFFQEEEYLAEPDFVDVDEDVYAEEDDNDDDRDEEEVQRLTRERGFGLGGFVDRLIGWSLFSVEEDGDYEDDDEDGWDQENDEYIREKKRREALAAAAAAAAARRSGESDAPVLPKPPEGIGMDGGEGSGNGARDGEEGGWQDAAWLLSVATKVLL
ncbi:MAG: hypothetical protein M1827_002907 [Pycnora praestabilis]|nr:MAG: hypothetical protein M1827_002907 [Pycnora praestabilis]